MNKLIAILALTLGVGFAAAHEGMHDEKAEAAGKAAVSTTVQGELVDLGCYLGHGASGDKHAKCAKMCVMTGGAPLGLLTKDGSVYLVLAAHGDEKVFGAAKELAGENAAVTGNLSKKGGLQAIMIKKVEKSGK